MESGAAPGDLILFNAGFTKKYLYDYYAHRNDLSAMPFPAETDDIFYFGLTDAEDIEKLASVLNGFSGVWLVSAHSRDPADFSIG